MHCAPLTLVLAVELTTCLGGLFDDYWVVEVTGVF